MRNVVFIIALFTGAPWNSVAQALERKELIRNRNMTAPSSSIHAFMPSRPPAITKAPHVLIKPTRAPVVPIKPSKAPNAPMGIHNATSPTALVKAWLIAHNTRRTAFFASHGKGSADLKWAESLAISSQVYANLLLRNGGNATCEIKDGYNGDNWPGGQNLAKSWGGNAYLDPDGVLKLWYEHESNLAFPDNLHYGQVIWRGTKWVGCAMSHKSLSSGRHCWIQVCRYIVPGNCDYTATGDLVSMALSDNPDDQCSPCCLPDTKDWGNC